MADISKIQVPGSATQYNIKDAQARRDIEDVKADLDAITPLTDDIKQAILDCFSNVSWKNGTSGKACYVSLLRAMQIDPLDEVAYGTLTYRDLFVTGNLLKVADFEGDITISDSYQYFDNGDSYKINAGTPSLSVLSGNHALKCFGTSSTQILYRAMAEDLPTNARILLCAHTKVDRYVSGSVGILPTVSTGSSIAKDGDESVAVQRVTDGFEAFAGTYQVTGTGAHLLAYIGSFSSANADAYIDDVVATVVPSTMTGAEGLALYQAYLEIVEGGQ